MPLPLEPLPKPCRMLQRTLHLVCPDHMSNTSKRMVMSPDGVSSYVIICLHINRSQIEHIIISVYILATLAQQLILHLELPAASVLCTVCPGHQTHQSIGLSITIKLHGERCGLDTIGINKTRHHSAVF